MVGARAGTASPPAFDAGESDLSLSDSARLRRLSAAQWALCLLLFAGVGGGLAMRPVLTGDILILMAASAFLFVAGWRVLLVLISAPRASSTPPPDDWPRYTIVAALHDEAEIVGQLVRRLARIDYPQDRLEGFLVLEAHDHPTITAARLAPLPAWLQVLVVPPGEPRTKPRALNFALRHARSELITVFDAEDDPDPGQLREAAARFAADPSGRLACLQAPLRIRRAASAGAAPFLDRQFAVEYAALFEVVLPGMARLGLPFPLGGTSNHFRVDRLRAIGGWDAWNVTEDADLGFRLWRRGLRTGVLTRPTWETPPGALEHWLPQRTRWLKGYMQTWGVHTRRPWALGARGLFALVLTLGTGLAAAAMHGLTLAWVLTTVLVAWLSGLEPETPRLALSVLVLGAAAAWLSCALGARRAGTPYRAWDMVAAPAYWSLLSLAFVHAAWRLARQPFAWDKTSHRPDDVETASPILDETPFDRLSAVHAAAPEPVA